MKSIGFFFFTLLLISATCEHKETISAPASTAIFSINSETGNGFSFERKTISMKEPDFMIIPQKVITGDALSPFLSDSDLGKIFFLVSEFKDSKSAQMCFDSEFIRIPETGLLQQFATNLKPNQVWIVRTRFGEYGKIWILDSYGNRSSESPYAGLKFKAVLIG
jgi:hypothetical protein